MKAILVVDIPEDYTGSVISVNLYGRNNRLIHEIYTNKLRPLPEKNTWDVTENGLVTEFAEGWNACLDVITGDKE